MFATESRASASPWPLLLIVAAVGCLFVGRGCGSPSLPPLGPAPAGPNMVRAFSTNDNRAEACEHMHAFETILDTCADVLEYDGKRPDGPRIKSGAQLEEFRLALREYRMKGWSFGFRYPELKSELQVWLDREAGDSGGPLDFDKDGKPIDGRGKWIRACRSAAESCRYARARG